MRPFRAAFLVLAAFAPLAGQPDPKLPILPTGTVSITFPTGTPGDLTFLAVGLSAPNLTRFLDPKKVRASATEGSGPVATIDLPVGRWTLGVDAGTATAPWIFENVDVQKERAVDLTARTRVASELTLLVGRRDTRKPIEGARVEVPVDGTPADRALAAILRHRAGASKTDGLLAFGSVPADAPLAITVEAKGLRRTTLKLPGKFEPGTHTVALAPFQALEVHVSGLTWKRGDPRPSVSVARCEIQTARASCLPQANDESRPVTEDGRARFDGLAPGRYGVAVLLPGGGTVRDEVVLSDDSESLDSVVVPFPLSSWRIVGRTHLRSGESVSAKVTAMEFLAGIGSGVAAETTSGTDGRFELALVSVAGRDVGVDAESRDPRGRGSRRIELKESEPVLEGADIVLETGAVEIILKERDSETPVPDCPVHFRWLSGSGPGGMMTTRSSDRRGRVAVGGLGKGEAHVGPACPGFMAPEPRSMSLGSDDTKDVEFLLDRSDRFRVLVLGPLGQLAAGARVFSLGGLSGRDDFGLRQPPEIVGVTSETGTVDVDGKQALRPFFVVLEGASVGIGRFPSARRCPKPEDCVTPVSLSALFPFSGLLVKATNGRVLGPSEVRFTTTEGLPIPETVLAEAARANQASLKVAAAGANLNLAPSLLPAGTYFVRTLILDKGPPQRMTWETRGTIRVPSFEVTTIVVPDPREGTAKTP